MGKIEEIIKFDELKDSLQELSSEIWGVYTGIDDLKQQSQLLVDKLAELQDEFNQFNKLLNT